MHRGDFDAEDCPTREAVIAWIVANQLGRRNLTPSQRAALALELEKQLAVEAKKRQQATLKQNQATERIILSEREKGRARDKAAEMVGASPAYVQQAKQIERDAPELLDEVIQGRSNIPQAKRVAALPVAQRPAAIERIHKKELEEAGGCIYRDGDLGARRKLRCANVRPRRAKVRQFFSVSKGAWSRRLQCRI